MEASTPAPAPKQMTLADVMAGEEEGDDPLKLPRASACDGLSWLFPGAARGRASGKLLFLDCDGVLNTTDAVDKNSPDIVHTYGWPHVLSVSLLRTLKAVLDQTGADIVLSSNWRLVDLGCRALERGLQDVHIPCDRIVGATPDLRPCNGSRQDEILAWLRQNSSRSTVWVAIDDLPLEREQPTGMRGHCVLTDAATGLDCDAAHACVLLLNAQDAANDATEPVPKYQRSGAKRKAGVASDVSDGISSLSTAGQNRARTF